MRFHEKWDGHSGEREADDLLQDLDADHEGYCAWGASHSFSQEPSASPLLVGCMNAFS